MNYVLDHPDQLGSTVSIQFAVDDDVDTFLRGLISRDTPEADRRISNQLIDYIDVLNAQGRVSYQISDYLFFGSASRDAEMAGGLRRACWVDSGHFWCALRLPFPWVSRQQFISKRWHQRID